MSAGWQLPALRPEGRRIIVALQTAGGEQTVTARWVIDASGRDKFFPCEAKRTIDPSPFPKRVAIYNHFHGMARSPGRAAGHTTAVRLGDGWFWIIPISAERTSVGLVTSIDGIRQARDPQAVFRATVEGSPRLRSLMERSKAVAPFRVTADYSYVRRDFASPRVILAGDAAAW